MAHGVLEEVPTDYYSPILQVQPGFDVETNKIALAVLHKGKVPPVSVALQTCSSYSGSLLVKLLMLQATLVQDLVADNCSGLGWEAELEAVLREEYNYFEPVDLDDQQGLHLLVT